MGIRAEVPYRCSQLTNRGAHQASFFTAAVPNLRGAPSRHARPAGRVRVLRGAPRTGDAVGAMAGQPPDSGRFCSRTVRPRHNARRPCYDEVQLAIDQPFLETPWYASEAAGPEDGPELRLKELAVGRALRLRTMRLTREYPGPSDLSIIAWSEM
jgi:hypothetical protein